MMLSAALLTELKGSLMKVYRPGYILLPEEQRDEYKYMAEVLRLYDYVVLKTNPSRIFS
ncbi:MAG: hypothetical protein K5770_16010 [Lachnospiraceae bacterium]|nr:hypothetical protein [Lachnospiraceae bacterium]